MSGELNHQPAKLIRLALVAFGHATHPDNTPPSNQNWPCYFDDRPDTPDNLLSIYDTEGRDEGRTQIDGERQELYGIQITVRASDKNVGWRKIERIKEWMDTEFYRQTYTIQGSSYLVQSINRTSGIIRMGREMPASRRYLYSLNGVCHILMTTETGTGT